MLASPFDSTQDIKGFIKQHQQLHGIFVAAGHPMSEDAKIQAFLKAIENDQSLSAVVNHYFLENPDLHQQTFANISLRVARHVENAPRAPPATVASYANAATSDWQQTMAKNMLEMGRTMEQMNKQLQHLQHQPQSQSRTERTRAPREPGTKQCWSHPKATNHTNEECRWPKHGHPTVATQGKLGSK